jgi:hypothetical protein
MAYVYVSDAKVDEILERRLQDLGNLRRSAQWELKSPEAIPFIPIPLPSTPVDKFFM